ncbi:hypothetical protein BgiBS90_009587 [Biomphalaria glabrata]|nr:hypothetical protein BgiBS90_009587 [Biomphalaria glabrata]
MLPAHAMMTSLTAFLLCCTITSSQSLSQFIMNMVAHPNLDQFTKNFMRTSVAQEMFDIEVPPPAPTTPPPEGQFGRPGDANMFVSSSTGQTMLPGSSAPSSTSWNNAPPTQQGQGQAQSQGDVRQRPSEATAVWTDRPMQQEMTYDFQNNNIPKETFESPQSRYNNGITGSGQSSGQSSQFSWPTMTNFDTFPLRPPFNILPQMNGFFPPTLPLTPRFDASQMESTASFQGNTPRNENFTPGSYQYQGSVSPGFQNPSNTQSNYQNPGNNPPNYQNPGNIPPNYQNPGNNPPNYQNSGNAPVNYQHSSQAPNNYQNPGNAPTNYQNPGNAPTNYQNPDNLPTSYQNPSNAPIDYQNPGNAPTNYQNPANLPTNFQRQASVAPSYQMQNNAADNVFRNNVPSVPQNQENMPGNSQRRNSENYQHYEISPANYPRRNNNPRIPQEVPETTPSPPSNPSPNSMPENNQIFINPPRSESVSPAARSQTDNKMQERLNEPRNNSPNFQAPQWTNQVKENIPRNSPINPMDQFLNANNENIPPFIGQQIPFISQNQLPNIARLSPQIPTGRNLFGSGYSMPPFTVLTSSSRFPSNLLYFPPASSQANFPLLFGQPAQSLPTPAPALASFAAMRRSSPHDLLKSGQVIMPRSIPSPYVMDKIMSMIGFEGTELV